MRARGRCGVTGLVGEVVVCGDSRLPHYLVRVITVNGPTGLR